MRSMLIGLIILAALGLGFVAYQVSQPVQVPVANAPHEAVPVPVPQVNRYLVAARPVSAGTLVRDEDFRAQDFPASQVHEGAILDTPDNRTQLRGALVRTYINARDLVTQDMVLRPRDRGFLAAVLAPGMRAISIPVDPISGVAGLIWPGDRVDILLVQEFGVESAPAAQRLFSEVMMADVRVIAIDQLIVQGANSADGSAGRLARVVTLQVSEDDAQRIAVGSRLGQFRLTIRSAEQPPAPAAPESAVIFGKDVSPTLAHTNTVVGLRVRVIQGDSVGEVTFK
jgi:pilus assembly protein CpaB